MASFLLGLFNRLVLKNAVPTLIVTALAASFFIGHATNFELDASSDSLVLAGCRTHR